MIILIGALVLGIAVLIWLWKVPVKKLVNALKKGGSSVFEAYFFVFLLTGGAALAIYMIAKVV